MTMTAKQREIYGETDDIKFFESVRILMDSKSRSKFDKNSGVCDELLGEIRVRHIRMASHTVWKPSGSFPTRKG